MKTGLLGVVAGLMILLAQGCLVIHAGGKESPDSPERYGADPHDATVVEIGAVSKLSFDSNRQDAYKRIAERQDLSEGAQVYLVAAVFKHLSFENAKMDVLLTLVNNPAFSHAAKRAILDRLDRLSFENNKTALLDAVAKR
jgi:hypothetical protein